VDRSGLLEAGVNVAIEVGGSRRLTVDQQGSDPDPIRNGDRLPKSILDERRPEAVALLRQIDSQSGQQNHRHRIPADALEHARWSRFVADSPGGQRVVTHNRRFVSPADHVDLARIRSMGLQGVPTQPRGLDLRAAIEGVGLVLWRERLDLAVAAHYSSRTLRRARNAASPGMGRGSRSSIVTNVFQRSGGKTKLVRSASKSRAASVA